MNIKLSVKFVLLAILVILAVGVPTKFFMETESSLIKSTAQELGGVDPAAKLIRSLSAIQDYRDTAVVQVSKGTIESNILEQRWTEANAALVEMQKVLSATYPNSDSNKHLANALGGFNNIHNQVNNHNISVTGMYDAFESIVDELIYEVVPHIMEESGLSYDPTADTYHLIIANNQNLPSVLEGISRIRAKGTEILSNSVVPDRQQISALASFIAQVKVPLDNMVHNLESSAENTDSTRIAEQLQQVRVIHHEIEVLFDLTKRSIIDTSVLNYDAQKYYNDVSAELNVLNEFFNTNQSILAAIFESRIADSNAGLTRNLSITGVVLVLVALLSILVVRGLNRSLKSIMNASESISNGHFNVDLDTARKDEFGPINQGIVSMAKRLSEAQDEAQSRAEEARLRLIESTRIEEALNATSTNVMIADNERTIIYMNRSVEKMLRGVESELQKVLPHFKVDSIIGSNMDIFHKNPSHQADLLASLESVYQAQIKVADLHFRLTANPIYDNEGQRIGSVVEWSDRTSEVRAEKEISDLVEEAAAGNFTIRANEDDKKDFMLFMAKALNQLMSTADHGLSDVARVLMALSNGDLTQRITEEYSGQFNDLKRFCNDTCENLTEMIGAIQTAAETISHAAEEIAQGNADLSSRTENQASNLEETASSMEQMTSTVRQNSNNVGEANSLSTEASKVAQTGADQIKQVVNTMVAINDSAKEISDIIGVIDSIAFQTNILALNAAVEAARAGEQGRGFAVVASEVRTLAQRSANAAKDIKSLISDSVAKVAEGNKLVTESGTIMEQIEDSIAKVSQLMSNIAAASAEQASGLDEINQAVVQMDEATQQNAALVEEAAASAESMRNQATALKQNALRFKTDDSSKRGDLLPKPTAALPKPNRSALSATKNDGDWEEF